MSGAWPGIIDFISAYRPAPRMCCFENISEKPRQYKPALIILDKKGF
jgi:hypothetical protein